MMGRTTRKPMRKEYQSSSRSQFKEPKSTLYLAKKTKTSQTNSDNDDDMKKKTNIIINQNDPDNNDSDNDADDFTTNINNSSGWTEPISYGCCCICHDNNTTKDCEWCKNDPSCSG